VGGCRHAYHVLGQGPGAVVAPPGQLAAPPAAMALPPAPLARWMGDGSNHLEVAGAREKSLLGNGKGRHGLSREENPDSKTLMRVSASSGCDAATGRAARRLGPSDSARQIHGPRVGSRLDELRRVYRLSFFRLGSRCSLCSRAL
jgi:hypothetical protein